MIMYRKIFIIAIGRFNRSCHGVTSVTVRPSESPSSQDSRARQLFGRGQQQKQHTQEGCGHGHGHPGAGDGRAEGVPRIAVFSSFEGLKEVGGPFECFIAISVVGCGWSCCLPLRCCQLVGNLTHLNARCTQHLAYNYLLHLNYCCHCWEVSCSCYSSTVTFRGFGSGVEWRSGKRASCTRTWLYDCYNYCGPCNSLDLQLFIVAWLSCISLYSYSYSHSDI